MKKYNVKILFCMFFILSIVKGQSLVFFNLDDLNSIKQLIKEKDNNNDKIKLLKNLSENFSSQDPFTITKYVSPEGIEKLHDYYSESPYWWPDSKDSTAPYIRYDGLKNPDRFMEHKLALNKFYKSVVTLSFTSFFLDNKKYASVAGKYLQTWFVDASTKMNPNLMYAQMIRYKDKKRGVGIIEGRRLALLVDAITLLKLENYISEDLYLSIKEWYREFLIWLTDSYYGIDEKQRGNNHSTWWAMQVSTISNFLGDEEQMDKMVDYSREFLLDRQIDESARQPLEEKRTKSLSYSIFNLTAHTYLAASLSSKVNNWEYSNKNNVSLIKVTDFLIPYLKNPKNWDLNQISEIDNTDPIFLAISGLNLSNENYLKIYNELSSYGEKKIKKTSFDPLQIVYDLIVNLKNEKR